VLTIEPVRLANSLKYQHNITTVLYALLVSVGSPAGSQSWVLTIDPMRIADSLQYQLNITTVRLS
jgi:hypothetical protein